MAETIQSVDRALEVLIYLEAADQETSITKMASDMGVYKSTIYRTLATLEARGFVRKNPDTDRYWLGEPAIQPGQKRGEPPGHPGGGPSLCPKTV